MTRPSSASADEDLFEAIATLLEPGQREYFYQRMLYFRHLRPEDELLPLVEAIGLLALLIREAPHAVAREREQMTQLLESSLATIQAIGEAAQAYQEQLDGRLTALPTDLAHGISPDAIARAITESLRQQFVHTGLPATADALTAISRQLTEATGDFQRSASRLAVCAGLAEHARGAIDQVSSSVAKATDSSQRAVAALTHQLRVESTRAVCWLCGAAWLFGILGGVLFERWRVSGTAVPGQVAIPSQSAESTAKKMLKTSRPHRRESHATLGLASDPLHGTVMEQGSNTDGTATGTHDAKP
jgi:hypothetical protein